MQEKQVDVGNLKSCLQAENIPVPMAAQLSATPQAAATSYML